MRYKCTKLYTEHIYLLVSARVTNIQETCEIKRLITNNWIHNWKPEGQHAVAQRTDRQRKQTSCTARHVSDPILFFTYEIYFTFKKRLGYTDIILNYTSDIRCWPLVYTYVVSCIQFRYLISATITMSIFR